MIVGLPGPVARAAHLWIAQRVSGLLLAAGLLVHLLRLYHAPRPVDYHWVTGMLSNPGWRSFHVALLCLLVFHLTAGVRYFLRDLAPVRRFHRIADWAVLLVGAVIFLLGLQALLGAPQVR